MKSGYDHSVGSLIDFHLYTIPLMLATAIVLQLSCHMQRIGLATNNKQVASIFEIDFLCK